MMGAAFTPGELANVFIGRWRRREIASEFISYLRPSPLMERDFAAKPICTPGKISFALIDRGLK